MKLLVAALFLLKTLTASELRKDRFRATKNTESFKELECQNSVQFLQIGAKRIEEVRSRACEILFPSQEPDIDEPPERLRVIEPKFLKKLFKGQPQSSLEKYFYGGTSSEQTLYSIPLDLKKVRLDDISVTMASPSSPENIVKVPAYLVEASMCKVKHPDYSLLIDDDCSIRAVLMKVYNQGCLPSTSLTTPWHYGLCSVINGHVDRRRKYYPSITEDHQLPSDSMRSASSSRISRSRRIAGSLGSSFNLSRRRGKDYETELSSSSLRLTKILSFRG